MKKNLKKSARAHYSLGDLIMAVSSYTKNNRETVAAVADLKADVLLVPHHGSAHQSDAFLQAADERLALISVGANNDYGHPAATTLARLARFGGEVHRTDRVGSIAVSGSPSSLIVTEQRPP